MQLGRAEGQLPRWVHRGQSQSRLRRQLWEVEGGTVEVPIKLGKVWGASAERWRVDIQEGCGQWKRAAYWWMVRKARWVLDELPQCICLCLAPW